jgi:hypothetical protein
LGFWVNKSIVARLGYVGQLGLYSALSQRVQSVQRFFLAAGHDVGTPSAHA